MHFSVQPRLFIKSVSLCHWLGMAEDWVDGVVTDILTEIGLEENLYFVQVQGIFD